MDARHIWNVIYNARSNRHHPPTSPNTAPATQNCTPKSKRNCPKTDEVSFTMRDRSENDPTMNSSSRTRPFAEVTFHASETHFVLTITAFRAPAIYPNFTEYCACHEMWHSKITKYCACHVKWLSWWMPVTYETSFTMCGAIGITLQRHQILHLPRKMTLMIDASHIWNVIYNARSNRHHPPTLQFCACHAKLYWAVTFLSCYFTEPLLYWAVTLLSCYFTELLLYWAVTLLSCYFTGLFAFLSLRNSEVSQLNFLWLLKWRYAPKV